MDHRKAAADVGVKPAYDLFIHGGWHAAERTIVSIDPTTGETLATLADAGAGDVDRAVTAARAAFDQGSWGRSTPADRKRVLLNYRPA